MRIVLAGLHLMLAMLLLGGCSINPVPFTGKEHAARLLADRALLHSGMKPLDGPLALHEAIARALVYNYDQRLAVMESVLQDKQLASATLAQLPRLAANAGFTARNNELASSSVSYETRQITLEPSISSQQLRFNPDLTLSWSLLDFGLSYFQAKQQADRYLVAQERRRRVVNLIVKEVVGAWWRALAAQRNLPAVQAALAEGQDGLGLLKRQEDAALAPLAGTLEQQKALLQTMAQLRSVQADLSLAKAQLASLINLPPASEFSLVEPPAEALAPPRLEVDLAFLETAGLHLRPDLREEMYQERIDRANIWKEVIRHLPVLSQAASLNYDSNIYLVNNFWAEVGLRATASLFSLVQGPRAYDAAKAQVEVTKTRRLALTMAALVQVNLGYRQYLRAVRAFEDAQALHGLEERLLKLASDGVAAGADPELERTRRRLAVIAATLERDRELAEAWRALGSLYYAVGADLVPEAERPQDLDALAETVGRTLARWLDGRFAGTEDLPRPAAAP